MVLNTVNGFLRITELNVWKLGIGIMIGVNGFFMTKPVIIGKKILNKKNIICYI